MTVGTTPFSIMPLLTMALSIMTHNIILLSIMSLIIRRTLSIMNLSITASA